MATKYTYKKKACFFADSSWQGNKKNSRRWQIHWNRIKGSLFYILPTSMLWIEAYKQLDRRLCKLEHYLFCKQTRCSSYIRFRGCDLIIYWYCVHLSGDVMVPSNLAVCIDFEHYPITENLKKRKNTFFPLQFPPWNINFLCCKL